MPTATSWPTASVAPAQIPPVCLPNRPPMWLYTIQPSHQLPTLDLSVTIRSRFFSSAAQKCVDRLIRLPRLLLSAYWCTTALYIVSMVTPAQVGEYLAVAGLLMGLPGTLIAISALRWDTICVLVRTYDIVFFDSIILSTLAVLMMMLQDARLFIVVQALIAYQINIFIDANIQAQRRVAIINTFAMVTTAFVGLTTTFGMVPNLKHFTLFRFGSHTLAARPFVTDGFTTILTIMLRNTYRKRELILNRSKGAVVDCVSYRCGLKLRPVQSASGDLQSPLQPVQGPSLPPYIQTMRSVAKYPEIDASHVVLPKSFAWLIVPTEGRRRKWFVKILGLTSATLAIGTGAYEFTEFKLQSGRLPNPIGNDEPRPQVHAIAIAAVLLSWAYTLMCAALYHRVLLRAIASSFDFIFLSTQVTFVHIAAADFFRWNRSCVFLQMTWLWFHWVFCIDALTPAVRERIGLSPIFVKTVMVALVMSTGILNHLLVFSEGTVTIHDRVIWSGSVVGSHFEFRLLATFYSTYVTVMAWALRLLWRVIVAKPSQLVMLDAPVAYYNYLRQPAVKLRSRISVPRLKDSATARIQLPKSRIGERTAAPGPCAEPLPP